MAASLPRAFITSRVPGLRTLSRHHQSSFSTSIALDTRLRHQALSHSYYTSALLSNKNHQLTASYPRRTTSKIINSNSTSSRSYSSSSTDANMSSDDGEREVNQTVYPPPPLNPDVAPIENTLELRQLSELGEDIYTNTRPQWHPPGTSFAYCYAPWVPVSVARFLMGRSDETGARGIYGGSVIAQSLAAALKSVPSDLVVHSMHCYFVLAGDSRRPVFFHVERVREGRSFATRTVQAKQRGKVLFTATCSFQRPSGGRRCLKHEEPMPEGLKDPSECQDGMMIAEEMLKKGLITKEFWEETKRRAAEDPFERRLIEITNENSDEYHSKRMRSWVRSKGRINAPIGSAPHYEALAYLSDSWFIGTVSRAHKTRDVGMMVSLDHTIYFHRPFRADEWMLMESDTPWAGDQRGFVHQRIMDLKGNLVATCYQEGLIRMKDVKDEGVEQMADNGGKRESKL